MEVTEEKPKPKRRKLIDVRVIQRKGKSALIEWSVKDDRRRAFVPADAVEDGNKCDKDVIDAGVPYGAPWEELVDVSGLTPEAVGREMRRRNLWTAADVEGNMAAVSKVIAALVSPVVIKLRRAAKQEVKDADN